MRTVDIPREAWTTTLDEFSTVHEGWRVSLDVLASTMGAQPEVDDLPLLGVSVGGADDPAITISAGRSWAEHITHTIHAPTRVQLERREDGADVALQIESADGAQAILRFRVAALPETVDGIVHR
jgi:Family of unknown function (DUF5335)